MLDFIRRKSTSFLSWLILGGIALIFGLQFGLPSDSLTLGADSLAKVHGDEIRKEDFDFQRGLFSRMYSMYPRAFTMPKEPEQREQVGFNEEIIDGIVERLLLSHEAREMGLAATTKEAESMVIDGHAMIYGVRLDRIGSEQKFNYEDFTELWLKSMRVAEPNYLEHQADELLAQTLRDLISASVLVPESEVRGAYDQRANKLSLRYARYEFSAFADLADPTPAQLDAYVADHAEDLDKQYESQKTRFTELPKQVRLGVVQVDDTPEARAALEAARAGIADGSQRFSAVARAQSTHDTANRGGDYGFTDEQSETASDLPDAVRQALPTLETGAVSEIIEADGLWLLQVSARREGDVPKEEALRELAEDSVRQELAEDLARRAAEEDQNAVAAGNPLNEVFAQAGALGETTLFGGTNIEDLPVEGEGPAEGDAPAEAEGPAAGDAPAEGDGFAGLSRPKMELRDTGLFVRGGQIPGLGMVPGLADDAWEYPGEAELLDTIYEVPGALVVAGVVEKKQASDEEYAEQREQIYRVLRMRKANDLMSAWAQRQCFDAKARGDIKVSESTVKRLTTYDTETKTEDEEGKEGEGEDAVEPAKRQYVLCERVGGRGGALTRNFWR